MRLRSSIGVLLVAILLVLAGCSSGGTNVPANPTSTATDSSTPTPVGSPQPNGTATGNGTLEVQFINVGQGSSTLLVGPTNETMLIDSGGWQDDGQAVIDYLQRENISRIDALVTSHADADHIGGHAVIIEHYETEADGIGAVYDPGIAASTQTYVDYLDAIETHDVTLYRTRAGYPIPFDGVEVTVLAPPETYLANRDRNENSLVLQVTYGNSSFLFPGDAAAEGEAYLVDQYGMSLSSTVLQVGHHGSRTSSSGAFLDAVSPAVAVISSDYDSQYGHPHTETLDRLATRDVTTLWTATHGSITLVSNGSHINIYAQSMAPTDPLDLPSAPAVAIDDRSEPVIVGSVAASQSARTQVVPDGGSTPEETTVAGGTTTGALAVTEIHADASGDERENLNDEYVVFTNAGDAGLDLSGWTVEDEADHRYAFPTGFTLDPGESVTLHTGSGTVTAAVLYWGSGQPVWNNGGDTITVTNAEGDVVLQESY